MSMNVQTVKTTFSDGLTRISTKLSVWKGRSIAALQSFTNQLNKHPAAGAGFIAGTSIALFGVAYGIARLFEKLVMAPAYNDPSLKTQEGHKRKTYQKIIVLSSIVATVQGVGLWAVSTLVGYEINRLIITAISVGSFALTFLIEYFRARKESEIPNINEGLTQDISRKQQEITTLKTEMLKLEAEDLDYKKRITDNGIALGTLTTQLATIKKDITENESYKGRLLTEISEGTQNLIELKQDLEKKQAEGDAIISHFNQKHEELDRINKSLLQEKEKLISQRETLIHNRNDLQTEIEKFNQDKNALEHKIKQQQRELQELENENKKLTDEFKRDSVMKDQISEELSTLAGSLLHKQKENKGKDLDLEDSEKKLKLLKLEEERLQKNIEEAKTDLDSLTNDFKVAAENEKKGLQELEQKKKDLEDQQKALENAIEQLKIQHSHELSQLQNQIEMAKKELQSIKNSKETSATSEELEAKIVEEIVVETTSQS